MSRFAVLMVLVAACDQSGGSAPSKGSGSAVAQAPIKQAGAGFSSDLAKRLDNAGAGPMTTPTETGRTSSSPPKSESELEAEAEAAKRAGEAKVGDTKPGEAKPGETKPGETKPGETKPGETKVGDAKVGDAKPGETKAGETKPGETKAGETKAGETKPGDKVRETKPGDTKVGDAKVGDTKAGDTKVGDTKVGDTKVGDTKVVATKPGETRPGDSKGETKSGDPKVAEAKPGETKPGDPKAGTKPTDTKPSDPKADTKVAEAKGSAVATAPKINGTPVIGTTKGPVSTPAELKAINISLLPNWERDVEAAGTISLAVKVPEGTWTFSWSYGYEDPKAPADRDAYKKWLADNKIFTSKDDRQKGGAWYLEGVDAKGSPAFRMVVLYGGKKLICYGSLYKESKLGDLRDQTVIQAKQICETLAL